MHRIACRPAIASTAPPLVETSAEALTAVLEDAAHVPGGHASGVAFPRAEGDVAALLRAHRAVLPIGAQSSLTGGATPMGEVVISMARMNRVLEIHGDCVRVEPGVPLLALQEALDAHKLYYPPVPTFTGATVGGTIATNAGGAATFKYGSTRPWIQSLTLVLSSGEVVEVRRGEVFAHPDGYFEIEMANGVARIPVPRYRMPAVAKRSAGYHAEPRMDLIDLFIGSEGTLGVVTAATLKVLAREWSSGVAFIPLPSERAAFALTAPLRDAAYTWRSGAPGAAPEALAWRPHGGGPAALGPRSGSSGHGDIPAIEYIDGHALALIGEQQWSRAGIQPDERDNAALIVQLELPQGLTARDGFAQIASFSSYPDTVLGRLCQVLADFGAFERTEIALPGDHRRASQIVELREAVPTAVNELVGHAKRTVDASIEKVAGDVIVPFERLGTMVQYARDGFERRGLDYAIWGHVSDGNLHPNVIPHSAADVVAGKEAILELGREVTRLGGCPLAEHGVGRNPVKQALLRQLYGESGIDDMRAVKRALDPESKLAPGVLFPKHH